MYQWRTRQFFIRCITDLFWLGFDALDVFYQPRVKASVWGLNHQHFNPSQVTNRLAKAIPFNQIGLDQQFLGQFSNLAISWR